MRAVERAVRDWASIEFAAAGGFGRRDPVAGVGRIPIPARACAWNGAARRVLVVGDQGVDDHVVAGEIAPDEVRVRKDPGVDDPDDDAARSSRQVPRRRQVHAPRFRGAAVGPWNGGDTTAPADIGWSWAIGCPANVES